MEDTTATAPPGEDIKPYTIHVSSKYLDLTRRKLELTRLPHERAEPKSNDWWEPKPQVEPLIDFWLEQYSWRDHEAQLNESLPQYRTSILIPPAENPTRVHFIHARSPHANAIPLLLIPPFPVTNLSLGHLIKPLIDPDEPASCQPFHVVVPSLPGLGFSDALPNNTPLISTTAAMLETLMHRLDYPQYLASNTGAGASSPSEIDWQLANHLSLRYTESCLGVHFISPPLKTPEFKTSPLEWLKWLIVSLLQRPMFGYTQDDLSAIRRVRDEDMRGMQENSAPQLAGLSSNGAREPNTLAYALCDSPIGLLLFVMMMLRVLGPMKKYSPKEIITITELTWLPGPEGALRYWAHCGNSTKQLTAPSGVRPRVGLTVFLGEDRASDEEQGKETDVMPFPMPSTYGCPAWARSQYDVVSTSRLEGKPGLIVWEKPEVIFSGVRSLAKAILAVDNRMKGSEHPGTELLDQVVVAGSDGHQYLAPAEISGSTVQVTPGSSAGGPAESPLSKKPLTPNTVGDHLAPPVTEARPLTPLSKSAGEPSPSPTGEEQRLGGTSSESSPDTVINIGGRSLLENR